MPDRIFGARSARERKFGSSIQREVTVAGNSRTAAQTALCWPATKGGGDPIACRVLPPMRQDEEILRAIAVLLAVGGSIALCFIAFTIG